MQILLKELKNFSNYQMIFTMSNVDKGSKQINRLVSEWSIKNKNAYLFNFLGTQRYLSLANYSAAVIGNSSSLLNEVSLLKKHSVLIGQRQSGRIESKFNHKVLDYNNISKIILKVINKNLKYKRKKKNKLKIYSSEKFINILYKLDLNSKKHFYDIIK